MTNEGTRKRGRPVGLLLNPEAFEAILGDRTQTEIAQRAKVTPPVLSELLSGRRGATTAMADRLAAALDCRPGVIFPELVGFRVAVRVFTAQGVET